MRSALPLALVALAALAYALRDLSRGEPTAIVVFALCTAVYVSVLAADRLGRSDEL